MKTLDELFNELTTSESDALKEEFLAALKDKESLLLFLKKNACQATVEEFQAFLQEKAEQNKEVGDEDLGAVSGGNWWTFAAASVASILIGCSLHIFVSAGRKGYESTQGKTKYTLGEVISCN